MLHEVSIFTELHPRSLLPETAITPVLAQEYLTEPVHMPSMRRDVREAGLRQYAPEAPREMRQASQ